MSLTVPLAVRVVSGATDKHITRDLRSLRFRSAAPGGYASATFSIDRPVSFQPSDISYFARVYVYDKRNGQTVWEGRLEDPGRGVGDDGQVWEVAALGPSAYAADRTAPLIYVDRDVSSMERVDNVTPGANDVTGASPGDINGAIQTLNLQFPQGLDVVTNSRVSMRYQRIAWAGQRLARYDWYWDAGVSDSNHSIQAVTRDDGLMSTGEVSRTGLLNTAGGGPDPRVVTTDFVDTRSTVELRQIRTAGGASVIPGDGYWVSFGGFYAQAQRYDKSGNLLLNGATDYPNYWLYGSWVVEDLLGRLLSQYDGANATVEPTFYLIDQLAYPDGVTPAEVLNDLMLLEPAYYWAAWESNEDGLYRFEWTTWPSEVRYEVTTDDGFASPGSAAGLYNSVLVRYKDTRGHIGSVRRTSTVGVLDEANLVREAYIDLSDDVGSPANAIQAGDAFLLEHQTPPNAGTLTVARPVLDRLGGRMVQPWEIKPGTLIRLRGVNPSLDSFNASARDGVTVCRVVSVDYDTNSATATLELDSYSTTTATAIARAEHLLSITQRRR